MGGWLVGWLVDGLTPQQHASVGTDLLRHLHVLLH